MFAPYKCRYLFTNDANIRQIRIWSFCYFVNDQWGFPEKLSLIQMVRNLKTVRKSRLTKVLMFVTRVITNCIASHTCHRPARNPNLTAKCISASNKARTQYFKNSTTREWIMLSNPTPCPITISDVTTRPIPAWWLSPVLLSHVRQTSAQMVGA